MVVSVEQRWIVGSFLDGRFLADLPAGRGSSWSQALNEPDDITAVLPWSSPVVQALHRAGQLDPWSAFIGYAVDGVVIAAGPVLMPGDYDHDAQTLTVTAKGAKAYYDRRLLLPPAAQTEPLYLTASKRSNPLTNTVRTGSLAGIVRSWLQYAHSWGGDFPAIAPPASTPGTRERSYEGVELQNLGEALTDLTERADGCDIQVSAGWSTVEQTYVLWRVEVGGPLLAGGPVVWDLTRAAVNLAGFTVSADGSQLATHAWVAGGRAKDVPLFARAVSKPAWLPQLDLVDTGHTSVTVPATLQARAAEMLEQHARPVITCTFDVPADGTPGVGDFRVGDWAVIVTDGRIPHLEEGPNQMRILSRSGGADKSTVSVTCAPVRPADRWPG